MVRLRDLGAWSGGNTPSKANAAYWTGGTVPWVSPKDMKVDEIISSEDHITEAALADGRVSLVPEGSVLFVTRSGILAHTLPVAVTRLPVTINQDLKALKPKHGVSPKYVAHAVRGASRRILKECSKHGTTVASIETNALLEFKIPMVDLDKQHRVVAEIEKQFSRLDEAVASLKRVKVKLKRYQAAVLKAAVEGRLVPTEAKLALRSGRSYETGADLLHRALEARRIARIGQGGRKDPVAHNDAEPVHVSEGWTVASVDQVGDVLLGRQRAPQYLTGKFARKYLRVANIKDDTIDFDDLETMDFDNAHFAKYHLLPGDILVSEGQSPELLGQSAIFSGYDEPLCFQKTLHRFRADTIATSPKFAQIVFRAHVKSGLFRSIGSITTNIGHLTLEKFRAAPFPLPPANEQVRIVEEVDHRLSIIEGLDLVTTASLKRASGLRQSSLSAFFSHEVEDVNEF
jgi:type I restriction enzyme S subunit